MAKTLRIATRQSKLALWQAEHIKAELQRLHPDLDVELVRFTTRGDKILDTPLAKIGGKGLFVKELENALLDGRADLAVHSMKDVPMEFPEGLGLAIICERGDPTDALVSNRYQTLDELPTGGRVGTSSLRRQCQLRAYRPDLDVHWLRGNVQTRLGRLDDGEFDAILLATSGLVRLELEHRITQRLAPELCLPAGGQGALGLETRIDDTATNALIQPLLHESSSLCVRAERALNRRLEGGCQVPIACYAVLEGDQIWLRGLVGDPDGSELFEVEGRGDSIDPESLGIRLAEELLELGAGRVLERVYGRELRER